MSRSPRQQLAPLNETTYYVLASLAHAPKHGYAIGKEVERLSGGAVRPGVGNLYVTLGRLLKNGLIERAGALTDQRGNQRKTYRLSGFGQRALEEYWSRVLRMARTPVGRLAPSVR